MSSELTPQQHIELWDDIQFKKRERAERAKESRRRTAALSRAGFAEVKRDAPLRGLVGNIGLKVE
jgi:hypothetical protein